METEVEFKELKVAIVKIWWKVCIWIGLSGASSILYGYNVTIPDPVFVLGNGPPKQFCVISNANGKATPVEVTILTRRTDENGQEVNEEADDDFIVFPGQLIIRNGEEKTVSLIYNGPADLKEEKAYRVLVSEVKVNEAIPTAPVENSQRANISVLLNYSTAIYVTPSNTKPNLILVSATPGKDEKGNPILEAVVANTGSQHLIVRDAYLLINQTVKVQTPALAGIRNYLVGDRLVYKLPWPAEVPKGPVSAKLFFTVQ